MIAHLRIAKRSLAAIKSMRHHSALNIRNPQQSKTTPFTTMTGSCASSHESTSILPSLSSFTGATLFRWNSPGQQRNNRAASFLSSGCMCAQATRFHMQLERLAPSKLRRTYTTHHHSALHTIVTAIIFIITLSPYREQISSCTVPSKASGT